MRLIDADALYDKYQEEMAQLLTSTNIENMSAEAISLLCGGVLIREAPTMTTEARLLTLEEADEVDCVWIEIVPHTIIGVRHVRLVSIDSTACMVYTFGGSPSCYNACDYNQTWRCWSARPTFKQQLEERWLDENTGARAL